MNKPDESIRGKEIPCDMDDAHEKAQTINPAEEKVIKVIHYSQVSSGRSRKKLKQSENKEA
jgi:hypothetical protein